jgi:uncharacterized Ntn-hydrolase superfamily protein
VLTRNGYSQYRQVTAIDHLGRTAHFSGAQTLGNHNAVSGEQCVAAGNMLADRAVIEAMVQRVRARRRPTGRPPARRDARRPLPRWRSRPVHSAAMVVVGELTWPIINLRVDWADENPIGQLQKLWDAYRPQLQDYIDRALDPANPRLRRCRRRPMNSSRVAENAGGFDTTSRESNLQLIEFVRDYLAASMCLAS